MVRLFDSVPLAVQTPLCLRPHRRVSHQNWVGVNHPISVYAAATTQYILKIVLDIFDTVVEIYHTVLVCLGH